MNAKSRRRRSNLMNWEQHEWRHFIVGVNRMPSVSSSLRFHARRKRARESTKSSRVNKYFIHDATRYYWCDAIQFSAKQEWKMKSFTIRFCSRLSSHTSHTHIRLSFFITLFVGRAKYCRVFVMAFTYLRIKNSEFYRKHSTMEIIWLFRIISKNEIHFQPFHLVVYRHSSHRTRTRTNPICAMSFWLQ